MRELVATVEASTIGINLADHVAAVVSAGKTPYSRILFLDGKARLGYIPYSEGLRHLHPKVDPPEVHFLNPANLISDAPEILLPGPEASKTKQNSRLLIFDGCVHSGSTLDAAVKALDYAGWETTTAVSTAESIFGDAPIKPDHVMLANDRIINRCVQFNVLPDETGIEKPEEGLDVTSRRCDNDAHDSLAKFRHQGENPIPDSRNRLKVGAKILLGMESFVKYARDSRG